jgi:flavorubredoxin
MAKKLNNDIYYVGVNDRKTHLFENMLPLPYGVSYNSYLILDEKTALIDTVEISFSEQYIAKIASILNGRKLDYLIINHMEPDHSGSIKMIRREYPDVQIIGNAKTLGMVEGYFSVTNNVCEIKDNDTLSLGKHELQFLLTPMVHWPETMMTYDKTTCTLFSGDAFGTFRALNGGVIDTELMTDLYWDEMIRYYANIVGKYGVPVQKALQKLADTKIDMICSTHGPVWTEKITEVVTMYHKLSCYEGENGVVIAYGSMYGNTEQMAEIVASYLSEAGVKNIVIHNLSKSDPSYVLADIFKYKGLIIGSPTYSNELYPKAADLVAKIKTRGIKNRVFGCFGSFTWAGVAVKELGELANQMQWEMCGSAEAKMSVKTNQIDELKQLAIEMAAKLV